VQSSPVDRLRSQPLSALHSDDIELVERDDDIEVVDGDSAVLPSMQSPISFQRRLKTPQARQLVSDMIASDSLSSFAPARVSAFLSDLDGVEMIHQESGVAAATSLSPIFSQGRLKTPEARQQLANMIASDSPSSFAPARVSAFLSDPDCI